MKIFTVEEANAVLPSVRKLLRKIQRAHQKLFSYHDAAKFAAEGAERGGGGLADGIRYAAILTDLKAQMSELESMGVQLKDFDRGLVDFPSLRDGRVVLLCWQIGEGDCVEWWHDVDSGFAGRTRL